MEEIKRKQSGPQYVNINEECETTALARVQGLVLEADPDEDEEPPQEAIPNDAEKGEENAEREQSDK